jgi:hypothetical protein
VTNACKIGAWKYFGVDLYLTVGLVKEKFKLGSLGCRI